MNKHLTILHGILKRAQRVHGLRWNVAAHVERQTVRHSSEFQVLSPVEVAARVRAAAPQDGALFTVAAFAGLRLRRAARPALARCRLRHLDVLRDHAASVGGRPADPFEREGWAARTVASAPDADLAPSVADVAPDLDVDL